MQNIEKKKVSIVCIGELHRDPATKWFITKYLNDLHEASIPTIFLHESGCDETPEMVISGNQNVMLVNNALLQHSLLKQDGFLQKLIKQNKVSSDLHRDHFVLKDLGWFEGSVRYCMPSLPDNSVHHTTQQLLQYASFSTGIPLFEMVMTKKIPAFGIEMSSKERDLEVQKILSSKDYYMIREKSRMETMAHNTLEHANSLKNGGVIFCLIGANHVVNFASYLTDMNKNQDIKITSIRLFSNYAVDGIESSDKIATQSSQTLDKRIFDISKQMKCHKIICAENPKNGDFISKELDALIDDAVKYNTSIESKQSEIVLAKMTKFAIDSIKLKKEQRDILGIDRVKATLLDRQTAKDQLALLSSAKAITIEKSEGDALLLTYPENMKDFVKSVVMDYKNFRKELEDRIKKFEEQLGKSKEDKGWKGFVCLQEKIKSRIVLKDYAKFS